MDTLFRDYLTNRIYMYPEHRDHDPDWGDMFPANLPYLIIPQGSSRSDKPFLDALALTLAAFRPDTKDRLRDEGLVIPTLQMIMRRSLAQVQSRETYLAGPAHPVVFDAKMLRPGRMVSLANAIQPTDIPPRVDLVVERDLDTPRGQDYLNAAASEDLATTGSAIARVWRSRAYEREMIVDASTTKDPNDRPLTFTWRLLQGDANLIDIEPLDEAGTRARITLRWHDRIRIGPGRALESSRIDIGVFANNGVHDSAPAMISVTFPTHQNRIYEPVGPDGAMRLVSISYDWPEGGRMDRRLYARGSWQDALQYDEHGQLTGWTRQRRDGSQASFTADGAEITERGADGQPTRLRLVQYVRTEEKIPQLLEKPGAEKAVSQ